jgi:hypothetical protein
MSIDPHHGVTVTISDSLTGFTRTLTSNASGFEPEIPPVVNTWAGAVPANQQRRKT